MQEVTSHTQQQQQEHSDTQDPTAAPGGCADYQVNGMEDNEEQNPDATPFNENYAKESFRLHMVTWNVATADPVDDVASLLQLDGPRSPDLYVIGLQEVYSGPVRLVADLAFDDGWSRLFMSTLAPLGYLKVSSIRMQGLLILVFSKLDHVPFIRDIQSTFTRTGILGYWGNKGGVSVRLSFYGHSLCFLNCHLAAHMQHASQRLDEFERILDVQTFEGPRAPSVLDHRLVFWFGDLNFRIQDHGMHFVRSCIENQTYQLLWSQDQLTMMKKKEPILQQFDEGPLDFQPTYKFDRNSNVYDSRPNRTWLGFNGKKRKPAWTDRILWRLRPQGDQDWDKDRAQDPELPLKITQESYTSDMTYSISDHKPVVGVFTLGLTRRQQTPLVELYPEGHWSADQDAMVVYSPLQAFSSSPWDWVGLFKVGFSCVSDYITYAWVKDDEVGSSQELVRVYVSRWEIPVLGGECVLCYYSSALHAIIGISQPFKVHVSQLAVEQGLVPEAGLPRP